MAKLEKHVTPKGIARWAHVVTPNTHFNPEGVFSIDFLLPSDEAQDMIDLIRDATQVKFMEVKKGLKPAQASKLTAQFPFENETDDDGNETGYVKFKLKKNAILTDSKTGKKIEVTIPVFDSEGTPLKDDGLRIGNGSTVRCAFVLSPYHVAAQSAVGVTLRLQAVQVIDLQSWSGDASSFGFGAEEGGFKDPQDAGDDGEGEGGDF